MHNTEDHDSRLSFRIDDHAWVEVAPLSNDTTTEPLDSYFQPSPQFQLLADLQQLDHELQHQLCKLTETNTVLATALQLLNLKIERLALQAGTDPAAQALQPITLSEGGVSIYTQKPLVANSRAALRIRLLPGGYALQSFARVNYCQEQRPGHYHIGLEFMDLDDSGRDLIARHILERQGHRRRNQRQQLADDDTQ